MLLVVAMKKNKNKTKKKKIWLCVWLFFSEVRAVKDDNLKSKTITKILDVKLHQIRNRLHFFFLYFSFLFFPILLYSFLFETQRGQ